MNKIDEKLTMMKSKRLFKIYHYKKKPVPKKLTMQEEDVDLPEWVVLE